MSTETPRNSDTPRTDGYMEEMDRARTLYEMGKFARTLERELTAAQSTIAEQAKEIERLRAELARFTAVAEYRQLQADWRQCVCGNYRKGELTGGWQCPVHGQQW